ncbi:kinase-like protein [Calocera viscosa TUFC12733]|uniref:Kinase-like protein n=1 Tax=Calocera viscosa (strain TUFC12733) TaxID=1330018 RepID=A0A167G0S0_CALVF|nr:kinase-like protein [Calocera viscosa TUFC12733]
MTVLETKGSISVSPTALAKTAFNQVLCGLRHLHSVSLVHADLKLDNIMVGAYTDKPAEVGAVLNQEKARRYPPRLSENNATVCAAVSQPLPVPGLAEAMQCDFYLADFGSAQNEKEHTVEEIAHPDLRAPEVFLGGEWDCSADIWTFGCLLMEYFLQTRLFRMEARPELSLNSAEISILWQMMGVTMESCSEQLASCKKAGEFFENGRLKGVPTKSGDSVEVILKRYKPENLSQPGEIEALAALVKKCLCLTPKKRATADELLQDPWWGTGK